MGAWGTFLRQECKAGARWTFCPDQGLENVCKSYRYCCQVDNKEHCRIPDDKASNPNDLGSRAFDWGEKKDDACVEAVHPSCGRNGSGSRELHCNVRGERSNDLTSQDMDSCHGRRGNATRANWGST